MLRLPTLPADTARRFAAHNYLPLPGLLPPSGLARLRTELARLEADARRRDFAMECMGGSPRHMTTIGGSALAAESPFIGDLYLRPDLLALLSSITGEPVMEVRDVTERHVINILHHPGDTHGEHTDDYPYALVLFLEAPADPGDGGLLEYAPHTTALPLPANTPVHRRHHRAGDAYLLRADTTAHRVSPLTRPGVRRTVLNFAYTVPGRQAPRSPSAQLLYEDESAGGDRVE
ncbi:HalD/BesD family halogenase [Streptomyces sp. 5.8]|uniref:HalD/BesD family halogenase n=1 Tax=Streptomyces sp. 5.8 TaxID=3406571 RepID=UPI003BB520F9